MTTDTVLPLTIAVCSINPDRFVPAVGRMLDASHEVDQVILIADVDTHEMPTDATWPAEWEHRLRVICNGMNLGLSASRNRALKEASTQHVVFLDDDIAPNRAAIDGIRHALATGAHLAGTRITADLQGRRLPWHLTAAQMHYLGCHREDRPVTIWGGSLAVDVEFARRVGVGFDEALGHRRGVPAYAEDTVFTRQLAVNGATVAALAHVHVGHLIDPPRLTLAYLTARARAQGRSEVQRGSVRAGLAKEWRRNTDAPNPTPRTYLLAMLYLVNVLAGVVSGAPCSRHTLGSDSRV